MTLGRLNHVGVATPSIEQSVANPFVAASRGFIDEVIMPHSTRPPRRAGPAQAAQQAAREPREEA